MKPLLSHDDVVGVAIFLPIIMLAAALLYAWIKRQYPLPPAQVREHCCACDQLETLIDNCSDALDEDAIKELAKIFAERHDISKER